MSNISKRWGHRFCLCPSPNCR